MKFNEAQTRAISHQKGPMLVLAGPGSGKTLVITNRIWHLIQECRVAPDNILVITFTKAAAAEMKQRFTKMAGDQILPVNFGTFHAVFFHILKYAYHFKSQNIIREEEKQQFFKEFIRHEHLELEDESEFLQGVQSEISKIKNEQLDLNHYYSSNCPEEVFKKLYESYDRFLRGRRLIDFDDMLVYCFELFRQRKDILAIWQRKYQYILIDEFQDINQIQYDIIRMLAEPENNLFVVGDDDQSIYRFRGANPRIMLHFKTDYPQAARVDLDINYRCSGHIISAAAKVIDHNQERFEKKLQAFREPGEKVHIRQFDSARQEYDSIVDEIINYQQHGMDYSNIAVLFRTNTQPRLLVQKLMEVNLPFRMKDVMPNLFDHWIVKNLVTYIRISRGSTSRQDFLQIMNKPNRYLSRDAFLSEQVNLQEVMEYYEDREWMQERIDRLEFDLARLQDMSPYAAVQYISKAIGYENYLREYAEYRRINPEELLDLLDEVKESAKAFSTFEKWFEHMENYGRELREQAQSKKENREGIALSTMHASKGLEYQTVFILDASEGITPHHKSVLEEDLEEERRMFYVAMTRAKDHLHIYYAKERFNKELSPSRFIGEILSKD